MTPAQVAHIMALVQAYAAQYATGTDPDLTRTWAAVEAALRDAPQAEGCGLCGADEAFTGSCGGGRNNPQALCFTPSAPTAVEPQTIVTERDPHPNAFMQVPKGTEIKAHWPSLVEPDERAEFEAHWKRKVVHEFETGRIETAKEAAWLSWQARASKGTK